MNDAVDSYLWDRALFDWSVTRWPMKLLWNEVGRIGTCILCQRESLLLSPIISFLLFPSA